MDNKKISVVTVCYNVVGSIEETMLSVLNQTYDNVEYIVIDGGSTDGTVDIVRKYSDRLAYWVSEPDKGIYDAMNKGIAAATGDYINFMNAGDSFTDNDVIKQVVEQIPNDADVVYGDVIQMYRGKMLYLRPADLSKIYEYQPFCHQSTLVKTRLMQKMRFDTSFRILGDYNFFYQCYLNGMHFYYIPVAISRYNSTEGLSTDSLKESLLEKFKVWGIEGNWFQQLPWRIIYIKSKLSYSIKRYLSPGQVAFIRKAIHRKRLNDCK